MARLLLTAILVFAHAALRARETPYINFESTSWEQVLQKAKAEKKYVFLYASTPGCRYCRQMEKEVFNQKEVSDFYNTRFVSYKINIEDGSVGEALAKKYGVKSYPTYLFFDGSEMPVHQSLGGKPAEKFIMDGENAFNPEKAIFSLKEKYDKGDRSPELLYNFGNALENFGSEDSPLEKVTKEYLETQSPQQLQSEKNLRFVFTKYLAFNSPGTQYLLANADLFKPLFGADLVQKRVQRIITNTAGKAGQKNDAELFKDVVTAVGQKYTYSNRLLGLSKIYFYQGQKNWNKYAQETLDYALKVDSTDSGTFYETAAYIKAFAKDIPTLETGAQLIKKAIALDKNYEYLCIYATLLHKTGKNKAASETAKEALALAESTGQDGSDAKELIAEISKAH
ncbi:thioredoxin family protein [Dyadobacter bucti]|uniref:thioredoxin family protein n=1 Tax=Dyadobacter bucti TaxID=2572203 RepID=UPI0011084196|nr:thioredoxin fold domain-containing protein [Dyadobacter bucti]